MRAAVMTLLLLLLGAGSALAQTGALPSPKAAAPAKSATDEAMAECMRLWDSATHMTKQEWSRTCKRVQSRLDNLKIESLDTTKSARKKGKGG